MERAHDEFHDRPARRRVRAGPHAAFERLRAERPVTRAALPGGWLVTRYADARAALADSRLTKDWRTLCPAADAAPDEGSAALDTHMLSTHPPDHHRLRHLLACSL